MKRFSVIFGLLLYANYGYAEEIGLGEEKISPLPFSKFNISVDYPINRQIIGMSENEKDGEINRSLTYNLDFEVGLFKYFNAGAGFNATDYSKKNIELGSAPILRFFFFAKPYLPLNERISIFSKFSLGLSSGLLPESSLYNIEQRGARVMSHILGFGGNAQAFLGMNFFFFSRLGLFVEGGIRADYLMFRPMSIGPKQNVPGADQMIKYITYEFPINFGVHLIL